MKSTPAAKAGLAATAAALAVACSSPTGSAQNMTNSTSDGPTSTGFSRQLDAMTVKPFFVDAYYSPLEHGPAQKMWTFEEDAAILRLRISNDSPQFRLDGGLYLFAAGTSAEDLGKWVNNQHSDALYGDAPKPVAVIPAEKFARVTGSKELGIVAAQTRNTWAAFTVFFEVDGIEQDGVRLAPFKDTMMVHLLHEKPKPRPSNPADRIPDTIK